MIMLTKLARLQPLAFYFTLAYTVSWLIWGIGAAMGQSGSLEHFGVFLMIGSFGPLIAALIVSGLRGGTTEIRAFLMRIIQVRVRLSVYLAVWLILPLVLAFGLLLVGFPIKPGVDLALTIGSLIVGMPINGFLTAFLSPGPLGEEPGWRGFALPRMMKFGEWQASVLLGILWAFWHLPVAVLIPEWRAPFPGTTLPMFAWLVLYPISTVALAMMLSKLWKWSNGSIFICILFHGVVNASFQILDKLNTPYSAVISFVMIDLLMCVAALIFAFLDRYAFRPVTRVPAQSAT
jgi:uncharacterized protein